MSFIDYPQLRAIQGGHGKNGREVTVRLRPTIALNSEGAIYNILARLDRARKKLNGGKPEVLWRENV